MRIGARWLLDQYGNPMAVAEAMVNGELDADQCDFAEDILTPSIIQCAKIRIELGLKKKKLKNNSKHHEP